MNKKHVRLVSNEPDVIKEGVCEITTFHLTNGEKIEFYSGGSSGYISHPKIWDELLDEDRDIISGVITRYQLHKLAEALEKVRKEWI